MSCDTEKIIIPVKRGSTFEQSLSVTDENDDIVNISGWLVESDLKASLDENALLSFSVDDSLFCQWNSYYICFFRRNTCFARRFQPSF